MFYCEECRVKNKWPSAFTYSHGKCECCDAVGRCWDRPSSTLPPVQQPSPARSDMLEAERVKFEAWATSEEGGWLPHSLARNPVGHEFDYRDDDVQGEWRAWKARAAHGGQAERVSVERPGHKDCYCGGWTDIDGDFHQQGCPVAESAPSGETIDGPEFQALVDDVCGAAIDAHACGNDHGTGTKRIEAESKLIEFIDARRTTAVPTDMMKAEKTMEHKDYDHDFDHLAGRGMHELRIDEIPAYLAGVAHNYGARSDEFSNATRWFANELQRKTDEELRAASAYHDLREKIAVHSPTLDEQDAKRYRYVATLQDWGDIERMCWSSPAKSATDFKSDLDKYIDAKLDAIAPDHARVLREVAASENASEVSTWDARLPLDEFDESKIREAMNAEIADLRAALARRATAAPSSKLPTNDEVYAEVCRERNGSNLYVSTNAVNDTMAAVRRLLARRATAGTTAAPSGDMSKAEIDDIVYQCRQSGNDTTYDIVNAALKLRATAGNAAPTEANRTAAKSAVVGERDSALRAEPAGQHDAATVVMGEYGPSLRVYGVVVKSWVGLDKWGDFANDLATSINAASRCRAEGGVTCNNSSPDLATPAATAAPGDLPPLPAAPADAASVRNSAFEDAASLCDRFAARQMHPAECAGAIRMMKAAPSNNSPVGAKESE